MTGADRLTEAEREALLETLIGGLPIRHGTTRADRARDILPTVEALLASLTAERDAALAAVAGIEEVAEVAELIAQRIEAAAEFEGPRAERIIRQCAHIARTASSR